jgi:hypothetical protein
LVQEVSTIYGAVRTLDIATSINAAVAIVIRTVAP